MLLIFQLILAVQHLQITTLQSLTMHPWSFLQNQSRFLIPRSSPPTMLRLITRNWLVIPFLPIRRLSARIQYHQFLKLRVQLESLKLGITR